MPVTAVFKNTGDLPVSATFIAKIYRNDLSITTIESPAQNVGAGNTASLVAESIPAAFGTYRIVGHVVYNGKITADKESFIDITARNMQVPLSAGPLITFIFLILLFIILPILRKKYKIVKRRR